MNFWQGAATDSVMIKADNEILKILNDKQKEIYNKIIEDKKKQIGHMQREFD